jgi:glycosyltransferase involved in cell wall biosynthesis
VSPVGKPLVSVIVPTRDRPEALERCLAALGTQSLGDRVEVVVVDDGSRAADEVAAVVAGHPGARLVRRTGTGPAAARNAGVRAARGSLLCFTDDDCEPQADWAERLADALQDGADAAAGTTKLTRSGPLADAYELIVEAPAAVPPASGSDLSFATSNNLACTRAVFEATPFDESYPHAAGEDRDWCARLLANAFVLRSAPAAGVLHDQELTLRRFIAHQIRYGQGAYRFRTRSEGQRPLEPPRFYSHLLQRAFAKGFRAGVLVGAAQVATAAGYTIAWAKTRGERRRIGSVAERSTPPERSGQGS